MLIHEVCERCGLTKKAVEYYEAQGLVCPSVGDNGYRQYSESDASTLREIALLRRLGLSVSDVRALLAAPDKPQALRRWRERAALRLSEAHDRLSCVDRLIECYDVDEGVQALMGLRDGRAIVERLGVAFPGAYGRYIALHFGRFLREPATTSEQVAAYDAIVRYLDELTFPPELEAYCERTFEGVSDDDFTRMIDATTAALDDYDSFIDDNRAMLDEYIPYRLSDEFRDSEAARVQRLMVDFQQQTGYAERLLGNLRLLSPTYAAYTEKMREADERLIERYPQAQEIYD